MSKRMALVFPMRVAVAIFLLVLVMAPVGAIDDAARLLARADQFRGGFDSFVTRMTLTNLDGVREVEKAEFEVSIKGENSHVRFLSARSKGQSLLMRGDDMWLFLPEVARPVRITPIQRLLGNVSNGDVARLRYSMDYEPTLDGEAEVAGEACTVLNLVAKRKAATYQRVRYYVTRADGRPVKAEYFLTSGKAIKTATFSGLREMAGRPILSRLVIRDTDRPASSTVIDFESITVRALPDKLFSPVRAGG